MLSVLGGHTDNYIIPRTKTTLKPNNVPVFLTKWLFIPLCFGARVCLVHGNSKTSLWVGLRVAGWGRRGRGRGHVSYVPKETERHEVWFEGVNMPTLYVFFFFFCWGFFLKVCSFFTV